MQMSRTDPKNAFTQSHTISCVNMRNLEIVSTNNNLLSCRFRTVMYF